MIKFLHAADIHLDSPMKGLERYEGAPLEKIRGATRAALRGLVDLAIEERVDFVVVAGDLYDGDWPDYNTGLYLARCLGRLREAAIPVFVIRGNHDATNRMTKSLKLPENVHLMATDRPETRRLEHLGVSIHGQGFEKASVMEDLSAAYPSADRGNFNIGLLHTSAEGAEGHEPYAPCTPRGLAGKGYGYWALGHIHKRQSLHGAGESPIEFPGNLQGRHARETGPKGCLLVTVDDRGRASSEFKRLDVVRWEQCVADVSGATAEDEVVEAVSGRLSGMMAEEAGDRLLAVRVVIGGATELHDRLASDPWRWAGEVQRLANEMGGGRLWIEKVQVRTGPMGVRALSAMDGPGAELMSMLGELRSDEGKRREMLDLMSDLSAKLPRELTAGAGALSMADPEWGATLLDEVEAILRSRLMGPEGSS